MAVAALEVRALEDLTLSVSAGDLVALLGPSSSGKTTMLLCTSLILEPTQLKFLKAKFPAREGVNPKKTTIWYEVVDGAKFIRHPEAFPESKKAPGAGEKRTDKKSRQLVPQ